MTRLSQLAVAIHEAGHAVAQLADPPAPQIRSLSIVDQPAGRLGFVDTQALWQPAWMSAPPNDEVRDMWVALARRDTMIYLAGPIAEFRWQRHSRAAIMIEAGRFARLCFSTDHDPAEDLGRARARIEWAYPHDPIANFQQLWLEAEREVHRYWSTIRLIGRTLYERGRLSGDELLALWEARAARA